MTARCGDRDQALLERAMAALQLSARATQRILRVARTIADLEGSHDIGTAHLTEAIGYRQLDRDELRPAAWATHAHYGAPLSHGTPVLQSTQEELPMNQSAAAACAATSSSWHACPASGSRIAIARCASAAAAPHS